jgi:MFS family permease
VVTVAVGFVSDKHQRRGLYILALVPLAALGFILLVSSTDAHVQYAGTFLAASGIYGSIPVVIAWITNNTEGVYKRGFVLGVAVGWGNLNGIVSSNIWYDSPRFLTGHVTCIAYLVVCSFGGSLLYLFFLRRENAARQAGKRDHLIEGKTAAEIEFLGDQRPDFVYTM